MRAYVDFEGEIICVVLDDEVCGVLKRVNWQLGLVFFWDEGNTQIWCDY